jgi:hypothetical protein
MFDLFHQCFNGQSHICGVTRGSDVTGSYVPGSRVTGRGYVRNRKYVIPVRASSGHWRHFRWKCPTKGIAKLSVAHAHYILPVPDIPSSGNSASWHVTSGDVTPPCYPTNMTRRSPEGVEGCAYAQPEVAQYPPSGAFTPEVGYRKWRHFPRIFNSVGWNQKIFYGNVLFLCVPLDKKCILILIFKSLGINVWIISSMFHLMKTKKKCCINENESTL